MKKKVLLIAYYWPPSGGPGVQRWLKMTHYMAEMGCDVTVLTVETESANYPHEDVKLLEDIHPSIDVIRTKAVNPYKLFGSAESKKGPAANFSVPQKGRLKFWLLSVLRSHLFIPDPRRGWNYWAKRAAVKICREKGINTVISTSPPHSSQLIGLHVKKVLGVKWIVDFRDPWTQIFYYPELKHSFVSRWIDHNYENTVVNAADSILHVGHTMVEMLSALYPEAEEKSIVIHNGYDERDFQQREVIKDERSFNIVYTGTLSSLYNFQPLFRAIESCMQSYSNLKCTITGQIPAEIQTELRVICPEIKFAGEVNHCEITEVQQRADLLLLILADTSNAQYILGGKVFEYLRTGNPILNLGPKGGDADKLIISCAAGQTFERDEEDRMIQFIESCIQDKANGRPFITNQEMVTRYSRENLAEKVMKML